MKDQELSAIMSLLYWRHVYYGLALSHHHNIYWIDENKTRQLGIFSPLNLEEAHIWCDLFFLVEAVQHRSDQGGWWLLRTEHLEMGSPQIHVNPEIYNKMRTRMPTFWRELRKSSMVWCHYNSIKFLLNHHNRHPIARPWGQDKGCL